MKKVLTRFLSLLILVLLTLMCLSACGDDGTSQPTDASEPMYTDASESTTAALEEKPASVTLVDSGAPVFRIVCSELASELERKAAATIYNKFKDLYPETTITLVDDYSKDGVYDSDSTDILIGATKYPESVEVMNGLLYGQYTLSIVGNKLVIASWQDIAMTLLVEEFCKTVDTKFIQDNGKITLTADDTFVVNFNKQLSALPLIDECKIPANIVSCGDSAYQLLFSSADAEMYSQYLVKLEANGFSKCASHEASGNTFNTYTGNGMSVTAYFTPFNKAMRIIVEPESNYYVSNTESYNVVTTPTLTMIGRKYTTGNTYLGTEADSGLMCFVIRLSDGRFIVIDGGISDSSNGASFSQAIYSTLKSSAPDPDNITIAAWIFTHSHGDHVGGYMSFANTYLNYVKIESILMNFPSEQDSKASNDGQASYQNFLSIVKANKKDTPYYKVHTGQVYRIADATVEIYYTPEDYVTANRTIASTKNWNDTSIIFSVDIAGNRIMFMGDSQEIPNNLTANMYGSYLKSDIVQIAHHGGIGGTVSIYKAIDPEIALFTTSDALVPVYIERFTYNDYLINRLNVKEYYNAGSRIKTWELPYHATSSGFIK